MLAEAEKKLAHEALYALPVIPDVVTRFVSVAAAVTLSRDLVDRLLCAGSFSTAAEFGIVF